MADPLVASFVQKTEEYKKWDDYATRLGFFLILGTTTLEMWGVWNQIVTIFSPKTNSVEGVSLTMKFLAAIFYFAAFNRGLAQYRLGLTIAAGCIAASFTPLLMGLLWMKSPHWWEWVVVCVALSAIALSFTDWHDTIFKMISTVIFVPLAAQPVEMFLKSTAEGLNPWDPFGFLMSCLAWTFYGHKTSDVAVRNFSLLYATTYATTLILWRYYTSIITL